MTNEMKLLMALCDALGFEVEAESKRGERMYDPTGAFCGYEYIFDYKLTKKPNNTEG